MVADTSVPLCCLLPLLAIGLVTLLYLCESSSLFATHTPSVVGLYHPVPPSFAPTGLLLTIPSTLVQLYVPSLLTPIVY